MLDGDPHSVKDLSEIQMAAGSLQRAEGAEESTYGSLKPKASSPRMAWSNIMWLWQKRWKYFWGIITIKMETEEENAVQRDSYLLTESLYISNSIGLWQRLFDDALLRDGQEQLPYSFTIWRVTGRCARSARGMHLGALLQRAYVPASLARGNRTRTPASLIHLTPFTDPLQFLLAKALVLLGSSWIDAPYCTPHVSFFVFM